MRKAVASLLPVMIVCAGACAHRADTNPNLPPRTHDAKNVRKDLKPYDTPNPGTASGPVVATPGTDSGGEADNARDRKITEDVRRAILADDSLSTDAKNVTVTTDNGVVTLDGTVASEGEKKLVAAKALQVAGVKSVENQTDVVKIR